ncbi:hypothetical protein K1X13_05270 [Nocardioides sp. WL0053]|uniref:Uncharacterized protein n=1 Tax=Nocardioides jiangsuensis TaxID=2866161 RepID=A0ABS7RJI1_9ACTN|nr:hypothetical protein [Nocardioides jiangsuensis]MBY9074228.1 hypothetical protein [Nocardioides jiangsuensis]
MDPGTLAEWFGASGSIAAAGGALYLLKREGEDRRELQMSEIRRESAERRRQATHVHVGDISHGPVSTDGTTRKAVYSAVVLNGSDRVINHVFLDFMLSPEVCNPMDDLIQTKYIGRMLPGVELSVSAPRIEAPMGRWTPGVEAVVGTQLWFSDAAGLNFHINQAHDVTEVDANPRRTVPQADDKLLGD